MLRLCARQSLTLLASAAVWLLAAGVPVWLAAPVGADDVTQGIDLFRSPVPNFFRADLPAEFFGMGSLAVSQTVNLVGEPLQQWQGDLIGNVDTIVLRQAATLACGGMANAVPIELVALNLVSAQPITVPFQNGPSQLWSVRACVSDMATSDGTMDITQVCDEGGTFSSTLTVRPKLVFTRLSDGQTEVMDPAPDKIFLTMDIGWVHDPMEIDARTVGQGIQVDGNCDGSAATDPVLPGTSNFFPGIAANPCTMCDDTVVVDNQIELVPHQQGDPMTDPAAAQHQATIALFFLSEIPTLSRGGLIAVVLLLALTGAWALYRRRRAVGG